MTSPVTKVALATAAGYLLWRCVLALCMLLFYLCKFAVLLPIVLFNLGTGATQIHVSTTPPPKPARQPAVRPAPTGRPHPTPAAQPARVPDLGPASVDTTGDWRQDRETLKRLLAEGMIK